MFFIANLLEMLDKSVLDSQLLAAVQQHHRLPRSLFLSATVSLQKSLAKLQSITACNYKAARCLLLVDDMHGHSYISRLENSRKCYMAIIQVYRMEQKVSSTFTCWSIIKGSISHTLLERSFK